MSADRLAALNQKILEKGLFAYWMRPERRRPPDPRVTRWREVYPLLLDAAEVMGLEQTERRLVGGYQIVMPGERAAAHRHTMSAMRFVVTGDGTAYTTCNGEQMFMEPGDLLVQPNWGWHDHSNPGSQPVIWMDMLDNALVGLLEAEFWEFPPERERDPERERLAQQPLTHPDGYHNQFYGVTRPARLVGSPNPWVPFAYKFRDTLPVLERMAAEEECDPHDGVLLEYTNPVTGGHTLPTMGARIQLLRPGEATRSHRHTGSVRYLVVQGQGVSTLDLDEPKALDWEDHDQFTIPSWRWHQHRNRSTTAPAILFSIGDFPIAETFGLYREEKA
ncbi:MAG: cupin domain-containing protein [Chloroflexi bacterium]|nr:cupin domain-containing protein [Chloroflexota bacterium]